MATGVLILGVNRATRMLGHLALHDKRCFHRSLGASSNTDDADGEVVAVADASALTTDEVDRALVPQRGDILQVPTTVSAIKVDGRRAYVLARAGEQVELKARPVTVCGSTSSARGPRARCVRSTSTSSARPEPMSGRSPATRRRARRRRPPTALRRTRIGRYSLDDAVVLGDEPPALMSMADGQGQLPRRRVDRRPGPRRRLRPPVGAARAVEPDGLIAPSGELLALYRPTEAGSRPVAVLV